jgi:hypothetical protein
MAWRSTSLVRYAGHRGGVKAENAAIRTDIDEGQKRAPVGQYR